MDTMTNGRVSDLELKHRTLNEQVDRFARRTYLTPQEQLAYAAMKKERLLTRDRLVAELAAFGGGQALLLATLGLYGVTAYVVWRRRTEMAIRIAFGGTPATVVRLILVRVTSLVIAGVLVGSGLALWASTYIAPLLHGMRPYDPPTFFAAAAILTCAGLLAGALPALRAARTDPAQTLRT